MQVKKDFFGDALSDASSATGGGRYKDNEEGLTPTGDAQECETVLDREQPLHGYAAEDVVIFHREHPCICR